MFGLKSDLFEGTCLVMDRPLKEQFLGVYFLDDSFFFFFFVIHGESEQENLLQVSPKPARGQ